nr:NADH dehydrogenase subunit 4 [Typhlocyba bilaminata]
MMKFFFFFLFMILYFLFNFSWNLFQFFILLLMMLFIKFSSFPFFSYISYNFGLDYYSYGLIILTMLIISLMIISSNLVSFSFLSNFFLLVNLVLCVSLVVLFSTLNILVMYLFFEFSLIPLLVLIYTWGYQPERLISGLYLFFYTLFASLPFLLIVLNFLVSSKSLFFDTKFYLFSTSFLVHMFLIFSFMVKFPVFMVHFWLPSAHVQAPLSGSMILAGLMLKIGGYGFIRCMNIYETSFLNFSYIWYSISIVGCVLVSLICLIQGDLKCLIAYSSICHMGMCLLGILSMTKWGIFGSYLMMISHGLCSSAMFCLANLSYERYSSRSFFLNKGLINLMPSVSMFWFMFCAFNMSCPPSLNFLSEVFIINSMMAYWGDSFLYFIMISFFSACFSYYLYSYIQHGLPCMFYSYALVSIRELLLLMIHLIPLFILVINFNALF